MDMLYDRDATQTLLNPKRLPLSVMALRAMHIH